MQNELDPIVEALLRSLLPSKTEVIEAESYRPGYLPYPMRVMLRYSEEILRPCVVKVGRPDAIVRECTALRLLSAVGFPVPEVLVDAVPLPGDDRLPGEGRAMVVVSEMPGSSLPWCGLTSLDEADLTCRLVLEGVARLHRLTDRIEAMEAASALPRYTLGAEYGALVEEAGEWKDLRIFQEAVEAISGPIEADATPLVFSNGDYNPLNFLYEGQALCGFVDFEGACFENPHIGFAKFLIWSTDMYGWGAGAKAGLVERYLYTQNVSRRAFAPILVLRCLRHLIREVSRKDAGDARTRDHMLHIVEEGVHVIRNR